MIKSSLIKFTTSLNIYIAGLRRPQERRNAVKALLVTYVTSIAFVSEVFPASLIDICSKASW